MAVEQIKVPDSSRKAASDLTAWEFKLVKASGSFGCDKVTAATDPVLGVLANTPDINQAATVRMGPGLLKALSDGSGTAIAPGDLVGPNASGLLVKKTAAGANICGRAEEASAALGIVISFTWIDNLGNVTITS